MSIFKLDINYKKSGNNSTRPFFFFVLVYKIQEIISVFAVSFFIAYLLDPAIDKLEAMKIPRALGIVILIVIIFILMTIAAAYLLPLLYNEIEYLIKITPEIINSIMDMVERFAERFNTEISLASIKKTQLAPKAGAIAKETLGAVTGIISSASGAIGIIVNLAIIPILVFYFLKDFDRMNEKNFSKSSNVNQTRTTKKYFKSFDEILSVYFRGQILVASILAVLYTVVLLVAGVKPAILIGLVSGILSIVPYLGFIIGFGTSLVLSIVQYQDILHPMLVIGGFMIVQLLEGNLITPKIVGESLGLHPTAVIFALLAGGSLFGIGGMIIALPIAAFIKIIVAEQLA